MLYKIEVIYPLDNLTDQFEHVTYRIRNNRLTVYDGDIVHIIPMESVKRIQIQPQGRK